MFSLHASPLTRGATITSARLLVLLIVIFNGLLILWLMARPTTSAHVTVVDNVAQFLGPLLVLPFCFQGVIYFRRTRRSPTHGSWLWTPSLLGLGILAFALGQITWTVYEQVLHQQTPFPSWADAGFLGAYPCLLAGILLLPGSRLAIVSRSRAVLDGLMIMVAIVTFSWYFVLGPTILTGNESTLAKIVGTAYPASDLVLIASLLLFVARAHSPTLQPVARVLCLALGIIVITDSVFDYETLHGTYVTGGLLDVGWPLGYMLVGLSASIFARAQVRNSEKPETTRRRATGNIGNRHVWHLLMPYALVPAVVALVVAVTRIHGDEQFEPGVYAGAAVLVGLVFVRQILMLLENAQLNQLLEALATTDPLTNIPNHRSLISTLDHELDRARRYDRPCSMIMLDLDHFKALNDGLGHPAGDTALQELSSVIHHSLRSIDIVGRWGGEEFVVILPETDSEGAAESAERIRSAVATQLFASGGGIHLTCSLGVASYPQDATERDDLVNLADRAMYAAKRLGRNQVRVMGDPAVDALAGEVESSDRREQAALMGTVEALAALVDARDAYTGQHARHVSEMSQRLALTLGLDASGAYRAGLAAQLHDVGKVGVPDAVLQKAGPLEQEEWALIEKHPAVGADILSRVPALRVLAPAIRGHHERWDGLGYPDRLAGTAIPLVARILSVADAYDAMMRDRPYRRAMRPREALMEIRRCTGTQFDPEVVDALERTLASEDELQGRATG